MPADVESMMYAGEKPWHGLGTFVGDKEVTSKEAIMAAGLNWTVDKRKLLYPVLEGGQIKGMREQHHVHALVRDNDNKFLGHCGPIYTPFQNTEAFEFFDEVVGQKAAIYHTAGALQGGRKVWILAKLNGLLQVVGDDTIEKYLLLVNTHKQGVSIKVLCTPIRVVCSNTLAMALGGANITSSFRIRHSISAKDRVKDVQAELAAADSYFKKVLEASRYLAKVQATASQIDQFLMDLDLLRANEREAKIRVEMQDKGLSDEAIRIEAVRQAKEDENYQKVIQLFEHGKGNDMPGVKGTYWAAYNAVTEYVDWFNPVKKTKKAKAEGGQATRLNVAWFGSGAKLKSRAFDLAVDLAGKAD